MQERAAFRSVTQRVTNCVPTQRVGTRKVLLCSLKPEGLGCLFLGRDKACLVSTKPPQAQIAAIAAYFCFKLYGNPYANNLHFYALALIKKIPGSELSFNPSSSCFAIYKASSLGICLITSSVSESTTLTTI